MRLIAVQEFTYANVPLKAGDEFEASDEDARMLIGFGKAKKARGRYRRTDMRAGD